MLLQLQVFTEIFLSSFSLQTIEMSTETIEQNAITPKIISNTSIFHRTSMLKTTSPATHSSPFLINRSISSQQQHIVRKSFLNRDTKTLEKLANLTKFSGDSETIANTATHKGNYVFTTTAKKSVSNLTLFLSLSAYVTEIKYRIIHKKGLGRDLEGKKCYLKSFILIYIYFRYFLFFVLDLKTKFRYTERR